MNKKRYGSSYVDYYDGKIFFTFDGETSLKVIDSTGSISRQSNDNQLYILLNSLEENVNSREEELTMEELKNELEEIKASKEYIQKYKEYLEKNNKVLLLLVKHK